LQDATQGGAESGALLTISDPGLALVVANWPSLSLHSRRIIVGMARKAAGCIEARPKQ
jgi:hypothetical protein